MMAMVDVLATHPVIAELRELRARFVEAGVALFTRMVELEADEKSWRADFPTFDDLLKQGNICQPSRYRNWREAVALLGEDAAKEIGVDASIVVARRTLPSELRAKVVQHLKLSRATNHVPASEQEAARVIDRLDTREKVSGLVGRAVREKTAQEENIELKRRVRALTRENDELKQENAELRERLSAAGKAAGASNSTARKPSRKASKDKRSGESPANV